MTKIKYLYFIIRLYSIGELIKILESKIVSKNSFFLKNHFYIHEIWKKYPVIHKKQHLIVSISDNKIHLRLKSSDLAVFTQIIINNEYLPLINIADSIFDSNKQISIVDLGANIGLTSIYLRKHLRVRNEIIAVEPDFNNFQILKLNCNPHLRIKKLLAAVWSRNQTLTIDKNFRDKREWARTVQLAKNKNDSEKVEGLKLQTILDQHNLIKIDILKIDIEGAEKELFLNDPSFLKILKDVKLIAIEVHEEFITQEAISSILLSLNFRLEMSGELIIGINESI